MTRRRTQRNESAVVKHPGAASGVDALIPIIEASWSDEATKRSLERRLRELRTGTQATANLVRAADVIEDGDLLFHMAQLGLVEALGSHALRALILAESEAVIATMAEAVATVAAGPDDSVVVSIATKLVAKRLTQELELGPFVPQIAELLEERFGPEISATVGDVVEETLAVAVGFAEPAQ